MAKKLITGSHWGNLFHRSELKGRSASENLKEHFNEQFFKPEGMLGHVAGFYLNHSPANIKMNKWTLKQLGLVTTDRVLEVGFGTGFALKKVLEIVTEGMVFGIDHSQVMVNKAMRRNIDDVSEGKLKLLDASLFDFVKFADLFDKVYMNNVHMFLRDKKEAFSLLYDNMAHDGVIAISYMNRNKNASKFETITEGERMMYKLAQSGFTNVRLEKMKVSSRLAVCAVGTK